MDRPGLGQCFVFADIEECFVFADIEECFVFADKEECVDVISQTGVCLGVLWLFCCTHTYCEFFFCTHVVACLSVACLR